MDTEAGEADRGARGARGEAKATRLAAEAVSGSRPGALGLSLCLSVECSPPKRSVGQSSPGGRRSPQIQSLSLEMVSAACSTHAGFLEDSWRGEILPHFLYLGDRVTASDPDRLRSLGITHIINATEDISNFFSGSSSLHYHRCPIKDRSDAAPDMEALFPECVRFLDSCAARSGRALVHCRAGVSRSATIVIGYLMQTQRWDLRTALHYVDTRRFVQPNSGFIQFLLGLERRLYGDASSSVADFPHLHEVSNSGWSGYSSTNTPQPATADDR